MTPIMTSITESKLNVALALAVPVVGLAYLSSSVSVAPSGSVIATWVALGLVWMTATVALTWRYPRRAVMSQAAEG